MEISAKHSQDKSIITIDKRNLIGVEGETFQNLIQASIDKGSKTIYVDLSKVEYISSWGIGLLVHAYTSCQNKNVTFNIENINEQVMNVLSQLKLTEIFNII
jgi:anti-anti-sigma factor